MRLADRSKVEASPPDIAAPGLAGDIVGTLALVMYSVTASVSFAALVFIGPASDGLPRGAVTFLLTTGIITAALGLRTKFKLAFGVVQDTAAIVLVPAVAVIVANGSDDPVRDVFVVLALSSLLTGAAMWSIGRAGLAGAVRFMPTTVVAGFLAGTGWLLAKGGFDVMTNRSLGLGDIDDLLRFDVAKFWLPGLALGTVVAAVPLFHRVPALVSSIATLLSTIVFFVIVLVASSIDAVEAEGWLLGPFPEGGSIQFVNGDLADADWSAVASAGGQIAVVLTLSILGLLLNLSGIQVLFRERVDLDAEMRTIGVVNMLVAPIGGLVGYHGLGDSALADRLGVTRRWVPIAVGVGTGACALISSDVLALLPKFAAGGLLIGAGLGLLISWVRELRSTSAWWDRAVSVMILAVICFVGILEGIAVGIMAACIFFVIRYSRIDAVRMVSSGLERRSVVERPPDELERLADRAGRLAVYELHGSLFFGSVSGVATTIRERLARATSPLDVVIVDFARVADIDSSAFAALGELAEDVDEAGALLVWSGLERSASASLDRVVAASTASSADDLDAALEFAEDHLLATAESDLTDAEADTDALGDTESDDLSTPYSPELLSWFSTRFHSAGDAIFREGDESDELVVVVAGSVHVFRTDRDGKELRLRTLRQGSIIGEIGFLTEEVRSASVTAETDVELSVLTADAHRQLRAEHPDLVLELYDRVLRSTAHRAAAIHRSLTQALR